MRLRLVAASLAAVLAAAFLPHSARVVRGQDCQTQLSDMQQRVTERFPRVIQSMETALADSSSSLSGYFLGHGSVILAGMGLTLGQFEDPSKPNLLFYWPTDSPPSEWLDFDGPDDPYRLVGWGYIPALYPLQSEPPEMECIPKNEWFVHEAGWHLLDGDMVITPQSRLEQPPIPSELEGKIMMWHEAGWDIHLWIRDDVPAISLIDESLPAGGLQLAEEAFWYPSEK
jgi:hypothetical protein